MYLEPKNKTNPPITLREIKILSISKYLSHNHNHNLKPSPGSMSFLDEVDLDIKKP